jgi:formimidoylglutamate deiminase
MSDDDSPTRTSQGARSRVYTADHGVIGRESSWVDEPVVEVDERGRITRVETGRARARRAQELGATVYDLGRAVLLPGMVNAHSHAFQRGIRGATQARAAGDPSDFWSWRQAMYTSALALTPDEIYSSTRACFSEMLAAGITTVGEFHYLHRDRDGQTYDDPNELSRQVIRAAEDVGIRLLLLEVYYARAGADRPPLPEQRRFIDGTVAAYLARVDTLRGECRGELVQLGIAPHSVRAVDERALKDLAAYARAHELVVHAHVSEQTRENEECVAEHGCSPTQLLARTGCLDPARAGMFTAVHAIHVSAADHALLAGHNVCACPTTEADLGDGIVPARE